VMVVEDARLDARFRENPFVTGEPHIRFYAGAPLPLGPGICVGTLCVVDHEPRSFSPEQSRTLRDLAQLVVGHLRLHQANSQLRGRTQDLADRERAVSERDHKLRLAEQMAKVGHWRLDVPSYQLSWSEQVYRIFGLDPASGQRTLEAAVSAYHPADLPDVRRSVAQALATGGSFERHSRLVRPDGQTGMCFREPLVSSRETARLRH
jgi:PAS domain-containing protein